MKAKKIIITISLVLVSLTVFVIAISATGANLSETKETTESTTVDVNADFVYEFKDEYDSYLSAKEESVKLDNAFRKFCEGKPKEIVYEKEEDQYFVYHDELMKYIAFTFTEEEIETAEKEKVLYSRFTSFQENECWAELAYKAASNSEKGELKSKWQKEKAELKDAEKTLEAYEKGEISIDEALERLGANYTGSGKPSGLDSWIRVKKLCQIALAEGIITQEEYDSREWNPDEYICDNYLDYEQVVKQGTYNYTTTAE